MRILKAAAVGMTEDSPESSPPMTVWYSRDCSCPVRASQAPMPQRPPSMRVMATSQPSRPGSTCMREYRSFCICRAVAAVSTGSSGWIMGGCAG